MITVLLFLWQLPQAIIGFFVWLFYLCTGQIRDIRFAGHVFYISLVANPGTSEGISLCPIIFYKPENPNTLKHEYGHYLQSLKWGWLYLPIVAVPSVQNGILAYWQIKCGTYTGWYNKVYPENEADILGDAQWENPNGINEKTHRVIKLNDRETTNGKS